MGPGVRGSGGSGGSGRVGSEVRESWKENGDDGWMTDPYLELVVVDVGDGRGLLAVWGSTCVLPKVGLSSKEVSMGREGAVAARRCWPDGDGGCTGRL